MVKLKLLDYNSFLPKDLSTENIIAFSMIIIGIFSSLYLRKIFS